MSGFVHARPDNAPHRPLVQKKRVSAHLFRPLRFQVSTIRLSAQCERVSPLTIFIPGRLMTGALHKNYKYINKINIVRGGWRVTLNMCET